MWQMIKKKPHCEPFKDKRAQMSARRIKGIFKIVQEISQKHYFMGNHL